MKIPFGSLVVGVSLSSFCWSQEISQASLERAKERLHAAVESGKVVGGAHLVVRDGEQVYFEAAGVRDIEDQTPFERDTIVRIYSMSKPITSVAAMTLFEQGKFELDDPVAKYIPAFEKATVFVETKDGFERTPSKRPITVRDVLRHTTGYAYGGDKNDELERLYQAEGMKYRPPHGMLPPALSLEVGTNALARIPAHHHPGERFTYGFNTDILGRLIEVWTGNRLDEYLREAVFNPLEMQDTGLSVPGDKIGRFASCHVRENGKLVIADKAGTSPYVDGFEFLSGGGGLVATIDDYANFCQMLVDDGKFNGNQVLRPATLDLMFTDQLKGVADDFQLGLGFAIKEVDIGSGERCAGASGVNAAAPY